MKSFILSLILLISVSVGLYAQEEGKDYVYLLNGEILSGTLVEINHGHYVRLMVDDRYLEPFLYKNIEMVIQNQTFDKPEDIILIKTGEVLGGIILKIIPNEKIEFVWEISEDTLQINNQDIQSISHTKKKLPYKVKMAYLGDYHYLSISPGIGFTHGGLGIRLQYRVGKGFGVGVHAGGGLDENIFYGAAPYFNVGVKLFFLNFLYINANYGTLGSYHKREYYFNSESYKVIATNYNGYGFMLGADFFANKLFGFTFSVGQAYDENFKYDRFIVDFGVVFKLALRPKPNQN